MKIEHVALYCRDLEGMKGFFEKYFQGVPNNMYHNPRTNLRTYILTFPDSPTRLEIMTRPEVDGGNESQFHVGFIHLSFSYGKEPNRNIPFGRRKYRTEHESKAWREEFEQVTDQ